jgi:hypothetical protein
LLDTPIGCLLYLSNQSRLTLMAQKAKLYKHNQMILLCFRGCSTSPLDQSNDIPSICNHTELMKVILMKKSKHFSNVGIIRSSFLNWKLFIIDEDTSENKVYPAEQIKTGLHIKCCSTYQRFEHSSGSIPLNFIKSGCNTF